MLYVVEGEVGIVLVTLDLSQIAAVIDNDPSVRVTKHIPGIQQQIPNYIYKHGEWRDLLSKKSAEAGH